MNDLIDGIAAGGSDRVRLASQVEALLASLQPSVVRERRRNERCPIPVLFKLTPLEAGSQPIPHEATIVVGKNISRRGLCFFHEQPISHRRAIIELMQPGLGEFAAEIDVTWCRFTKPGWYESGGRLVRSAKKIGRHGINHEPVEMSRFSAVFHDCLSDPDML
ncbi:MAG TPA: hypothetical protein VH107_02580 [Lacipirellulaceae bacterium]|jgi:hypothetical protein|nr:hypothetical protein [Lacipirellulaceae bacterium]